MKYSTDERFQLCSNACSGYCGEAAATQILHVFAQNVCSPTRVEIDYYLELEILLDYRLDSGCLQPQG